MIDSFRVLLCGVLIGCVFASGCEDPEKKARYVKAPLETGDLTSRIALEHAVSEARTRLLSVHDSQLRDSLSRDIGQAHSRADAAIREAEQQRAAADERQEKQQRASAIALKLERERKLAKSPAANKEAVISRRERHRAAVATHREGMRAAVATLEVGVRNSLLGDGTKVLMLRNPTQQTAGFELRCHTVNDVMQKTFSVVIPPGGEQHVGFLQGWCGNFKQGERCEAYVDGERIWQYKVPF